MTYGEGIALLATIYGETRDRLGKLALLHPIEVAEQLAEDDTDGRLAALFHDAWEDEFVGDPNEDLPGLPQSVMDAIDVLTRRNGEEYAAYIDRVSENHGRGGDIARRVKVADLSVNFARCLDLGADGESLRPRYASALRKLA